MTDTILYYEKNADGYAAETSELDFHEIQDLFLFCLPEGARILDLGCGAGRDSKYFSERGFSVRSADGSEAMCRAAEKYTGVHAECLTFSEALAGETLYGGIWACASLLHLKKQEIAPHLAAASRVLEENGILYASFKYGTAEEERDGRHYTDLTEKSFREILAESGADLREERIWTTRDVRPRQGDMTWLNIICRRRRMC